ncbi:MAG: hypothetical protein QM744_09475 [Mesorhizobium sp.]
METPATGAVSCASLPSAAAATPVIASNVLAAARAPQPGTTVNGDAFQFAAGSNAVYWVQQLADFTSGDANVARYVFRAALSAK